MCKVWQCSEFCYAIHLLQIFLLKFLTCGVQPDHFPHEESLGTRLDTHANKWVVKSMHVYISWLVCLNIYHLDVTSIITCWHTRLFVDRYFATFAARIQAMSCCKIKGCKLVQLHSLAILDCHCNVTPSPIMWCIVHSCYSACIRFTVTHLSVLCPLLPNWAILGQGGDFTS